MRFISVNTWIKKGVEYFKYLSAELLSYINYLNAGVIGFIINIFTGHGFPGKPAPYIVPVIVQSLSKSAVRYKNRHMSRLVQLPSEREDPVFIMAEEGKIILSTGLTYQRFKKNRISNIKQIIGENNFKELMDFISKKSNNKKPFELYSGLYKKWYEIKIKSISSGIIKQDKEFLIWFTDITALKIQEKRMSNMLQFSNDIISSLPMTLDKYTVDDIYKILAEHLLSDGFRCVFIAVMNIDDPGKFRGSIYTYKSRRIENSKPVNIEVDLLPCSGLKNKAQIITVNKSKNITQKNFDKKYSFDKIFNSYSDFPVKNFITFKSENIYILALNKKTALTKSDNRLMELIVENINTILKMKESISSYFTNYVKALNEDQF